MLEKNPFSESTLKLIIISLFPSLSLLSPPCFFLSPAIGIIANATGCTPATTYLYCPPFYCNPDLCSPL